MQLHSSGHEQGMVEDIKLLGSIVGLMTGVFVLFDRWIRGRPLAWIGRSRVRGHLSLYVRNIAPIDILITRISVSDSFKIAKDDTIRGIASAMSSEDFTEVIAPEEVREFPLLRYPEGQDEKRIHVKISWRKSDSTWWQPKRHVKKSSADMAAIRNS